MFINLKLFIIRFIVVGLPFVKWSGETKPVAKKQCIISLLQSIMANNFILLSFLENINVFGESFQLTVFYGISLRDIVRSSIILVEGYKCARKVERSIYKRFLVSLSLGIILQLGYGFMNKHGDVREYGHDLNFFIVLASSYILFAILRSKHNFKLALSLSILHEYGLRVNKVDCIIFSEVRNTWFMKNKEGLNAIIPSFILFLFASYIGRIMTNKKPRIQRLCTIISVVSFYWIAYGWSKDMSAPSRRLGNISYIMLLLSLFFTQFIILYVLNYFVPITYSNLQRLVSKNMIALLFTAEATKILDWKQKLYSFVGDQYSSVFFFLILSGYILCFYFFNRFISRK